MQIEAAGHTNESLFPSSLPSFLPLLMLSPEFLCCFFSFHWVFTSFRKWWGRKKSGTIFCFPSPHRIISYTYLKTYGVISGRTACFSLPSTIYIPWEWKMSSKKLKFFLYHIKGAETEMILFLFSPFNMIRLFSLTPITTQKTEKPIRGSLQVSSTNESGVRALAFLHT